MNSFIIAMNAIFPICILIGVGYFLKIKKVLSRNTLKEMNQVVFKILIPINLMQNIIKTNINTALDLKLVSFSVIGLLFIIIISMIIVPCISKERKKQGVIVQALYRTNYVLLAIPICESLCGKETVGVTALLVSIVVPIINLLAVLVLQYYGETSSSIKSTLISLIKNPMIVASIIGIFIQLLNIPITGFVSSTINKISSSATPIALIILGGTFELANMKKNIKEVIIVVVGRLVIIPLILLPIAILVFQFRGISLASILVLVAGPVAVSSFPMAEAMGLDGKLAGEIVFTSTLMCLFTLFVWITIISYLGLL